jgi:hypothetical protein
VGKALKTKGATLAFALDSVVGTKMSLSVFEPKVSANEMIALAEEAHATAPSKGTRGTLIATLLFRASQALVKAEPDYAAMNARAFRSLGSTYLIAVALSRGGKLRDAALANKDVQRAISLIRDEMKAFPQDSSPWRYAMLRAAHPEEAAKIAASVVKDDVGQLERYLTLKLSPASASAALDVYWAHQIAGEEAKGVEVLKACAARGVPLPFDLK